MSGGHLDVSDLAEDIDILVREARPQVLAVSLSTESDRKSLVKAVGAKDSQTVLAILEDREDLKEEFEDPFPVRVAETHENIKDETMLAAELQGVMHGSSRVVWRPIRWLSCDSSLRQCWHHI